MGSLHLTNPAHRRNWNAYPRINVEIRVGRSLFGPRQVRVKWATILTKNPQRT
jgi:hypothetical protein